LCFSTVARRASYRKRLLRGLLLGNSRDTQKRYQTVNQLFAHGLMQLNHGVAVATNNLNEEDAEILEDGIEGAGVSNLDVVLHFYGCAPSNDCRALQSLAVFELLSLGLNAIFRAAVVSVAESGTADLAGLARSIASV